jgi:LPXTG-motif cell wall-anchored protein
MNGKNNISKMNEGCREVHWRYGLRKLASGVLVSAAIGGFVLAGTGTKVQASADDSAEKVVAVQDNKQSSLNDTESGQSADAAATSTEKTEQTPKATPAASGDQTTAASTTSDAIKKVDFTINLIDDDDNGKLVWTHTDNGEPGTPVPFNLNDFLNDERTNNHKDYTADQHIQLPPFPTQTQTYEIHLKHQISKQTTTIFVPLHVEFLYGDDAYNKGNQVDHFYDSTKTNPFNTVNVVVNKQIDGVTHKSVTNYQVDQTAAYAWLSEVKIPSKRGYTPDPTTLEKKDIYVPGDFSEKFMDVNCRVEIKVTYHPDPQKAIVKYVDVDDNNKVLKEEQLEGTSEQTVDYRTEIQGVLNGFLKQKYVQDPTDTKFGIFTFDTDDDTNQIFYVHLKRNPDAPKPEPDTESVTKTITNTVHYVMSDGSKAPEDHVQTITFSGTKNKKTGTITWNAESQSFDDVVSPEVQGYTPDKATVKGTTVTPTDKDIKTTVTYTKDAVIPVEPPKTPDVPDSPVIPAVPVVPATPSTPDVPETPEVPKTPATPEVPAAPAAPAQAPVTKQTAAPVQPAASAVQLPQTGNKQNRAGLIGFAVAAAGLLLGLSGKHKKD